MSLMYREYHLSGGYQDEPLDMPVGAEIKRIERSQEGKIRLIALIDSQQIKRETRLFKCIATGTPLPSTPGMELNYLGSVQLPPMNWHVHEWTRSPVAQRELETTEMAPDAGSKSSAEPVKVTPSAEGSDEAATSTSEAVAPAVKTKEEKQSPSPTPSPAPKKNPFSQR